MASLDFPSNPTNGQTYALNGVTYYYNSSMGAWLTQLTSMNLSTSSNTQVLFNDAGLANGSSGLVFDKVANTVSANAIVTNGIITSNGAITSNGTVKSTSSTGFLAQNSTVTGSNALRIINNSGSFYFGTENSAGTDYSLPSYATFLYSNYSSPMCFVNNGAERMRIDSSGNVAIGTASSGIATNGVYGKMSILAQNYTNSNECGTITLASSDSYAIDKGGSIGFVGKYTSGGASASFARIFGSKENSTDGNWNGYIGFAVAAGGSPYERIRIGSDGTLYNGSPGNFTNTSGSGRWATYRFELSAPNTTAATDMMYFRNTNGIVGAVGTTGSSTYYNTSSDYRLKENVVPMVGALDKVLQMKPVNFIWKSEKTPGQGFIAHELQEIIPDAVTGHKDAVDEEGNPHYQGVDASFLVATLTAAIQELSTKLDQANARIAALESINTINIR